MTDQGISTQICWGILGSTLLLAGCGGGSGSGSSQTTTPPPLTTTPSVLLQTNINTCATANQNQLLCNAAALEDVFGLKQDGEVKAGRIPNYKIVQRNNQRCIEEATTGLTWELKTSSTDDSIHNVDYGVYWYEPDGRKNGGNAGLEHDFNAGFAAGEICGFKLEYCNTHAFIQKLNAQQYCGYSDWRLPSPLELSNLVDYGATEPPLVYDPVVVTVDSFYWTSIPAEVDSGNGAAKAVSFFRGSTTAQEVLYAASVIAVRGKPFPSAP